VSQVSLFFKSNPVDSSTFIEFNMDMALTNGDLKQIENIVDEKLDEKLDDKLAKLKSDIFDRIDPILKEVTTAREERPLIENRIEKLEEIHPHGQHSFTE
jgi:hypothetical protein